MIGVRLAFFASFIVMLGAGCGLLLGQFGEYELSVGPQYGDLNYVANAPEEQAPPVAENKTGGRIDAVDSIQIGDSAGEPYNQIAEGAENESKYVKLWKSLSPIPSGSNTKLPGFQPMYMVKGYDILLDSDARAFQAFIIEQPIDPTIDAVIIPHQDEPQLNDTSWYFIISNSTEGQPIKQITEPGFQNQLIFKSLKRVENKSNKGMKRSGHSSYITDSWLIPPAWKYQGADTAKFESPVLTYALNRHDDNGTRFNELHHVWIRPEGSTRLVGINLAAGYSRIRKPYADLCNRALLAPDTTPPRPDLKYQEGTWNVEDYICNTQVTLAEEGFDFGSLTLTMFLIAFLNFLVMIIIWVTEGASSEAFVPKGASKRRF